MSDANQQDVAALVAMLNKWLVNEDYVDPCDFARAVRDAATLLSTLAAERDETGLEVRRLTRVEEDLRHRINELLDEREANVKARNDFARDWDAACCRAEASEARATALEAERDRVRLLVDYERGERTKDAAEYAILEAQLARAGEALSSLLNTVKAMKNPQDTRDVALLILKFSPVIEEAERALRSPAPADGRGDQMLASASCPRDAISRARRLAARLFEGVTDKGGKPYIGHCERVEARLPDWVSEDARCAALLHDVIEDTSTTGDDLISEGFSFRTVHLVEKVSRRPEDGTYIEWIRALAASGDAELIAIKLADNLDNSDPTRIAALPPEQRDIAKRYERARRLLEPALIGSGRSLADAKSKDLPSEARADGVKETVRKALASCEGEQYAFEEWAKKRGLNMEEHPMFYIFTDKTTDHARYAWKACLNYAREHVTPLLDAALTAQDHADVASQGASLPDDMVRLIIAARIVAYGDEADAKTELDKAVEAFADRVPWDEE
jgi:hypothetical protein